MEELLYKLIPEIENKSVEYKDLAIRRYNDFYAYSEIPRVCYGFYDQGIIPPKLGGVFKNIKTAVEDGYNFLIMFSNYKNLEYIAYLMMEALFKQCILDEDLPNRQIIYADIRLLMQDYKNLIDLEDEENITKPSYSKRTLNNNIYSAPMVIWNKLSSIKSAYDKEKLEYIVSRRVNDGLGNIYFYNSTTDKLMDLLGVPLYEQLKIDLCFDCRNYKIEISSRKDVEIFKC